MIMQHDDDDGKLFGTMMYNFRQRPTILIMSNRCEGQLQYLGMVEA